MTRHEFFEAWARFLATRYRLVLGAAGIATVLALLAMTQLGIRGGRVDLLGEHNPVAQSWLDFGHTFGSPNNVVLLFEGGTAEQRRSAVDIAVAELEPHKADLFRNILYKVDDQYQVTYGVYYIEKEPIEYAENLLSGFAGETTWPDVFEALEGQASVRLRTGLDDPRNVAALDGLASLMQAWADIMETGETPDPVSLTPTTTPLAFDNRLSPVDRSGYLVSNDGERHILVIDPSSAHEDRAEFLLPFMKAVLGAMDKANVSTPEVGIRFTGMAAYAYEDVLVIQNEVPMLTIAALVILVLLFLLTFGSLRPALYAGVCLLLAVLWCFGLTALTVGYLTILSSTVGLILLGLGIDYGLHLVVRYQEERVHREPTEALIGAYAHGANGILTGGATTIAAFGLCGLADFAAFAELGIITSIGIGCNLVAMLTVLPALLMRREAIDAGLENKTFGAHKEHIRVNAVLQSVGGWLERRASFVVGLAAVAAILAIPQAMNVPFDFTFLATQPVDSPYPETERVLHETTNFAPHFNISLVEDDEEAEALAERMTELPSVSHTMYARQVLPKSDPERDAAIQQFRETAGVVHLPGVSTAEQLAAVEEHLNRLRLRLSAIGRSSYAIADKEPLIRVQKVARSIQKILAASETLDPEERNNRHNRFLAGVADAWIGIANRVQTFSPEPPTMDDVPDSMRRRFLGDGGRQALYVVPTHSLWDLDALTTFNAEVATVDPNFTGVGALLGEMYRASRSSAPRVGKWIGLAVLIVLMIDFRQLRPVLAASLAVILGLLLTLAGMRLFNLPLSVFNMLAIPLLLGIGVDSGVHVLHRLRTDPDITFPTLFSSTGKAVSMASLTSLISFGLLTLSTHRGLSSFALVISIGIVMCYFSSLVVLPCAWSLAEARDARRQGDPTPAPASE